MASEPWLFILLFAMAVFYNILAAGKALAALTCCVIALCDCKSCAEDAMDAIASVFCRKG